MKLLKTIRSLYEYMVLYGGLLFFALICLAWSVPASLLRHLLPRRLGETVGQYVIMLAFRAYLLLVRASGLVKCDLAALKVLRDQRSLIITTNHPSLIDVVLIASQLPRIVCVLKAQLLDNLLLGGGARMAGYIRNNSASNLVRESVAAMRRGGQLLIFPEGTRTVQQPVNEFKGGFGLAAKKSGVPVQTVFIMASSPFLGKGWSLWKKPEFPLIYRVRLGECFYVNEDVKVFVTDLERYYREQLTRPNGHGNCVTHDNEIRHDRFPDGTTSHSTRLPKDGNQVAGYLPSPLDEATSHSTSLPKNSNQVTGYLPQCVVVADLSALQPRPTPCGCEGEGDKDLFRELHVKP